jgi:hypothetical protein
MVAMLRWTLTLALALLLILHVLCVPFYSGASISPTLQWRLEHARLTIKRTPPGTLESFYIAVNSEGLRFSPGIRVYSNGVWYVRLPLWMPIAALALPTVFAWRSHRRRGARSAAEACPKCGYARTGLSPGTPCPECGAATAVKAAS